MDNSMADIQLFIKKLLAAKTTSIITKYPRLSSLVVGFAITLAVGTSIGIAVNSSHHMAYAWGGWGCFDHAFNRLYQNG